MKMTKDHYNRLKELVDNVITVNPELKQLYHDKNLSMMRYRWDLYHHATHDDRKLTDNLYKYLDDNNIDTALKSITDTK
jgi:hypothetical protein